MIPSDEFLSVLGGKATFRCLTPIPGAAIVSVEWLLNGIKLKDIMGNISNVSVVFTTISNGNGIGSLLFADLPLEYNNTQVSCSANFTTGEVISTAASNLIILQGKLHVHADLGESTLSESPTTV